MPLYEEINSAEVKKPDTIAAWKPDFKTPVVDTRYTPQSELLAYIEGSTWVVDYYSQVLDEHSELIGQDTSLSAPLQQYKRIWSLELKVTQDLTQVSQDSSTNEFQVQGSANVYPFLVPQVGDMFRAGIADGKEGLFKVIRVETRQIFKDRAHTIEYQLIAVNDTARIYDLDQKTQVTYYFVKDFLLNHQNPLLVEEDYKAGRKLEAYWHDLIYLYFTSYFSREYMTLLIPNQNQPTYDHCLTDFVRSIMDSKDDVHIQSIRLMNIGSEQAINSNNIWTVISRRDPKLLKYSYTKTGLISRGQFHRAGLLGGMRFSGISQIVYPINPHLPVDYEYHKQYLKSLSPINIESKWEVPDYVDTKPLIHPPVPVKPVDFESGYVLSESFYKKDIENCSLLERLIHDYLDHKLIDSKDILKLCDNTYEWGHVERFYYIPLLLILIKYYLRRL